MAKDAKPLIAKLALLDIHLAVPAIESRENSGTVSSMLFRCVTKNKNVVDKYNTIRKMLSEDSLHERLKVESKMG